MESAHANAHPAVMRLYRALFLVVLIGLLGAPAALGAPAEDDEEFSAVHHSEDGFYLDFSPFGTVELPRIFLVRGPDGGIGLDVFGSTAAALQSGRYQIAEYGAHADEADAALQRQDKAREAADSEEFIAAGEHLYASLQRAEGHVLLDLSITRHLCFAIFAGILVALAFIGLARKYKRGVGRETAPKGLFQNMMETVIVFIRDEVAKPNLGDYYLKYLPYLLSLFFFILTCNLLGLFPFGATATSNLTITGVLAVFTFFATQLSASREHWQHIFNPPVPLLMKPLMIPVEIIGLFTKPFALAIRLFANMTAGHLVILSLIGLIFTFTQLFGTGVGVGVAAVSVLFSLFIYLLEIIVALIQAYIFTILSALFIGMAIEEHEHEPELAEGDTPPLSEEDRGELTPHLPGSGDGVGESTQMREREPAPTG